MSIEIIQAFSGQKAIVIYPVYLEITGDYATAAALAQVLYWHKVMNGKFYKIDSDFEQELHLTPKQFRRVKTALKSLSFLKITVESNPAKTFYDVDYSAMTTVIKKLNPKKGETRPAQKGETRPAQKGETRPAQKGETRPAQKGETLYTETTTENTKDYNNAPDRQTTAPKCAGDMVLSAMLKGLDERQKAEACKKLATLSADQRNIAIQSFNKKIVSGEMKSPMAYLNVLVEKGLKNALEAIKTDEPNLHSNPVLKTPAVSDKDYHSSRIEVIKVLLNNPEKKERFLNEFNEKGFVFYSLAGGAILKPDLEAAGLFN